MPTKWRTYRGRRFYDVISPHALRHCQPMCAQLVRDDTDSVLRRVRPDVSRRLQDQRGSRADPVHRQTHVRLLLRVHDHRADQHAHRHAVASLRNHLGLQSLYDLKYIASCQCCPSPRVTLTVWPLADIVLHTTCHQLLTQKCTHTTSANVSAPHRRQNKWTVSTRILFITGFHKMCQSCPSLPYARNSSAVWF